ncbi:MAG: hypothetical protein KAH54_00610 [Candidatus Sabulitectum sp.]|nr:hypothetical protein [Candidatus Sabulitectum sp.]
MYKAMIITLTVVATLMAGTVNFAFEGAGSTPIGGWGENLSNGLAGGLYGDWLFTEKLRAGLGFEGAIFGDAHQGNVSFTQLKPMVTTSFYLRPHGVIFNPGVVAGFGYCRSQLSSGGGIDPASWDLFWRAGIRWDFSLGSPWRAGLGFDLESIMASEKPGDAFRLTFGVSREVQL